MLSGEIWWELGILALRFANMADLLRMILVNRRPPQLLQTARGLEVVPIRLMENINWTFTSGTRGI